MGGAGRGAELTSGMIGTHAMVGSRVVALLLLVDAVQRFFGTLTFSSDDAFCAVEKRSNSARKMNVS